MAARNEGIFEELAAGDVARLDVIDLEVGREVHFGRVQQREVAAARNPQFEGCGVVYRKLVAGEGGRHAEPADSAAEGGRGPVGQAADVNRHGVGGHPLAYALVVVLEELLEYAAGRRPVDAHVDHADKFGRVNHDVAGLLGDKVPAAEQRDVVDPAAYALPVELKVRGVLSHLVPETVEIRELDILKTDKVHSLVEFERGGHRLPHHDVGLAEFEREVDVVGGHGAGGGRFRLSALTRMLAAVGHHLNLRCVGRVLPALDRGFGGRQQELALCLGQ